MTKKILSLLLVVGLLFNTLLNTPVTADVTWVYEVTNDERNNYNMFTLPSNGSVCKQWDFNCINLAKQKLITEAIESKYGVVLSNTDSIIVRDWFAPVKDSAYTIESTKVDKGMKTYTRYYWRSINVRLPDKITANKDAVSTHLICNKWHRDTKDIYSIRTVKSTVWDRWVVEFWTKDRKLHNIKDTCVNKVFVTAFK